MGWGTAFFTLLGMALAVLWLAKHSRATTGLPAGRLVYSDTTRWQPVERPLFSRSQRLTGRPDYLVRHGRDVIPVEVKSGHAPPRGPYASHLLQLAAYCLLVEEAYGRRPSYGIILYADDGARADQASQAFEIDYSVDLEAELLTVLDAMRCALVEGDAPRDHDEVARCQACSYRGSCEQALS
jgi:CRISPR-associated exonuclease Cas4